MAGNIWVRPVRDADAPLFSAWAAATPDNEFDQEVLRYRSTSVLVAFNEKGPLVFMPIQKPFMLEGLAINPEASMFEIAAALKELTQAVVSSALAEGGGEIYFLGTNQETIDYAEKHGYEQLPWRVLRIRTADLEKQREEVTT